MKFDSQQGAQQQIEEWAKATPSISSREKSQINVASWMSGRILGDADLPKSDKEEFVIIRRDGLNCD